MSIFHRWGMPQYIKVDNGRPFGDPTRQIVPPLTLWLIGLGINVIFNRPRTPQDNAKVERSQGVLAQWTEYEKCQNHFELQARLWQQTDFHNLYYPVTRLGNKTRLEYYPKLLYAPNSFNPAQFDIQKVWDFIAKGAWEREVSAQGQFYIWGQRFSIGRKYAYHKISIKLNPQLNQWRVFDDKANLIKTLDAPFSTNNIWNLDVS